MIDNKRCILIADDEPKMVRALRDFFRANGFCVLEAKNGIEAFDVFCAHTNEIDIILLDVMMPEQDGLTTLKEIRGASSLIPVILLTAKGEEYDQLSGFSSGADDYIINPFFSAAADGAGGGSFSHYFRYNIRRKYVIL